MFSSTYRIRAAVAAGILTFFGASLVIPSAALAAPVPLDCGFDLGSHAALKATVGIDCYYPGDPSDVDVSVTLEGAAHVAVYKGHDTNWSRTVSVPKGGRYTMRVVITALSDAGPRTGTSDGPTIVIDGKPTATPKPTPKPTPKITPKPTAKATPRPTAKPTPKATPKVTSAPTAQATPEPTATTTAKATPAPLASGVAEATPGATPAISADPSLAANAAHSAEPTLMTSPSPTIAPTEPVVAPLSTSASPSDPSPPAPDFGWWLGILTLMTLGLVSAPWVIAVRRHRD